MRDIYPGMDNQLLSDDRILERQGHQGEGRIPEGIGTGGERVVPCAHTASVYKHWSGNLANMCEVEPEWITGELR